MGPGGGGLPGAGPPSWGELLVPRGVGRRRGEACPGAAWLFAPGQACPLPPAAEDPSRDLSASSHLGGKGRAVAVHPAQARPASPSHPADTRRPTVM